MQSMVAKIKLRQLTKKSSEKTKKYCTSSLTADSLMAKSSVQPVETIVTYESSTYLWYQY